MGENTSIEYVHNSFSPWWGCSHAGSPGCDHCFAREHDRRFGGKPGHWEKNPRLPAKDGYWGLPLKWDQRARREGERRRVLCPSMCDVFEDRRGLRALRARLFPLVEECSALDWLLLTKRPENVGGMVPKAWMHGAWPGNVWAGTTIEHQPIARERAEALCALPAPVRFVSAEPLLGELTLLEWMPNDHRAPWRSINWVIAGGESGIRARAPDPRWVLWLRDQCKDRRVPFFFKQWGRWVPQSQAWSHTPSGSLHHRPDVKNSGRRKEHGETYYAVGKKKAGRFLGGYRYEQLPGDVRLEATW